MGDAKTSNRELKLRSHCSDSYLGKPLFSLFCPRVSQAEVWQRQILPVQSRSASFKLLAVQPWTWTAVHERAVRCLAEASTTDRLFLSHRKHSLLPCTGLMLTNTRSYSHCFEQWRRAGQQILQCLLLVLCNTIPGWKVLYIIYTFFNLHCLSLMQHQPTSERKLGWNKAQTWGCSDSITLL